MKIALIGATGYVGAKILDEALARGHQVTAVGRNRGAAGDRPGLTAKVVDVHDVAALAEVLKGHDAVINGFSPGRDASQDGIFEKFPMEAVFGAHNWPGMKAGQFALKSGPVFASSNEFKITLKGKTIPHEVEGVCDGGRVLLKPAPNGTGLIVGGGMRPVLEAVGIRDAVGKSLGSKNRLNVVKATMNALLKLRSAEEIATARA
jgi:hypothetical protein